MSDGLKPDQLRRCVNAGCRVVITGWAGENCHECHEQTEKLTDPPTKE